ncbi:MAG: TetR/AcrR family transcriptional regulator [Nannocystales bacterium]
MRPRQFTDAELFAAAREVILAHGPSVSAKRIAEELGVSAAALFKRVGTKHELIRRALVGANVPEFVLRLEQGPDDRPVQEQLLERALEMDAFFTKAMPAIAMLKAGGFCPSEVFSDLEVPPPIRALRAMTFWFETLRTQGRVTITDSEAIAMAFIGALQAPHALRSFLPSYPDGGSAYLSTLVETTLHGIAPQQSES